MKGLYLFGAWCLPAVVGLTMAAVGGFWVFLGIFAVVSALVQWAFIRPHWRKLEADFHPALRKALQVLEESKWQERGGEAGVSLAGSLG